MLILGINAYHGDASAALLRDGQLVAAVEEERLTRVKHCAGFPEQAIRSCLEQAGARLEDVDHVAVSRDPSLRLMNKVLFALKRGPRIARSLKDRLTNVSKFRGLREELCHRFGLEPSATRFETHKVEHHRCHVASAFLASPFEEAACASVDGFGDFVSTMLAKGAGTEIDVIGRVDFPHSLGAFYTMVTQFIGFRKYGDEGKVMGLAPYGEPRYLADMAEIVKPTADGSFELDTSWFKHATDGVEMTWEEGSPTIGTMFSERMIERFGPPREPGSELTDRDRDLAASLQKHLEERLLSVFNALHAKVGSDNLCLAGGVALNCVTNGLILEHTPFKELYVQAASADSGTALGAALSVHASLPGAERSWVMEHAYTGPEYSDAECAAALEARGLESEVLGTPELYDRTAAAIAERQVVGWFQGRMEFGPRALGNRSIVADPRAPDMKDILNSRIKHREPFRPFAPAVQEERTGEFFEKDYPSPFMNLCYAFREEWRDRLPAVDHVDHTGRLQTVSRNTNERFWELIEAFRRLTGVGLVLNTSFNENEPIVCTPEEAIACYLETDMDVLVLGDRHVSKARG